jgi:hypothetical protein
LADWQFFYTFIFHRQLQVPVLVRLLKYLNRKVEWSRQAEKKDSCPVGGSKLEGSLYESWQRKFTSIWKVNTCRLDIVGELGEFSGQGLN